MTAVEVARRYVARGWSPIPIPFREKGPGPKGWQHLRLGDERALTAYFNGGPQNIGVVLGAPSGGLVDVDLDSAEAVRHRIKQLIDAESAQDVLSDDTIVEKLREAGIDIARRTVAKYREAMRIPSSVQRRREKQALAAATS